MFRSDYLSVYLSVCLTSYIEVCSAKNWTAISAGAAPKSSAGGQSVSYVLVPVLQWSSNSVDCPHGPPGRKHGPFMPSVVLLLLGMGKTPTWAKGIAVGHGELSGYVTGCVLEILSKLLPPNESRQ